MLPSSRQQLTQNKQGDNIEFPHRFILGQPSQKLESIPKKDSSQNLEIENRIQISLTVKIDCLRKFHTFKNEEERGII